MVDVMSQIQSLNSFTVVIYGSDFFFFFFCSTLPNWLKKTWLHIYDTIPVFRLQGISKCLRDPLKFAPEMNNYIRSGTSEY